MSKRPPKQQRSVQELAPLKLGEKKTTYATTYDPALLEKIKNQHGNSPAWVSLVCTEFTSLCPKTGQPDFAKIFINYVPGDSLVESKSLKLYLFGFRNHGDFHEDCVQTMCDDLAGLLKPRFLEVIGEFTPRGGIAIFPYSSYADARTPKYVLLRDTRFASYRPGHFSMDLARLY